jgi:hypothetical protein
VTGRREGPGYASRGGKGLHLILYNRPLFEDLKLKREEGGIREEVSYIYNAVM